MKTSPAEVRHLAGVVNDAGIGEPLAVADTERDVGSGIGRHADLVGSVDLFADRRTVGRDRLVIRRQPGREDVLGDPRERRDPRTGLVGSVRARVWLRLLVVGASTTSAPAIAAATGAGGSLPWVSPGG